MSGNKATISTSVIIESLIGRDIGNTIDRIAIKNKATITSPTLLRQTAKILLRLVLPSSLNVFNQNFCKTTA